MKTRQWFAAIVAMMITTAAQTMTFTAAPPFLYLGGSVVAEDWNTWEEAMIRHDGTITTIVMHDSGGGDAMAGRRIGMDIRKRGLDTVVSGRCASACANMFLAGVTRQFAAADTAAPDRQNVLGYHGSYNKVTKAVNTKRPPDYFVEMSDGKMSEEFVERFIKLENRNGLMRFFHRDQLKSGLPLAQLCTGAEERAKRDEQCAKLPDVDALSKGVVTTWEPRKIALPPTPSRERVSIASWNKVQAPRETTSPAVTSAVSGLNSPNDP